MSSVKRVLHASVGLLGELMMTLGVLVFAFAAWQVWWTDVVSARQTDVVRGELMADWAESSGGPQADPVADLPAAPPADVLDTEVTAHEAFALVYIPRFGPDWGPRPIVAGTGAQDLKTGFGYYEETAGPGQVGNFSLAGHRVTYGKPLFNIETMVNGDPIVVETDKAWFVYRMTAHEIVKPADVAVIAPVPGQPGEQPTQRYVTLTACHPKFSAQERYIVHGVLDSWQPKSMGVPAVLANDQEG